ncbi:fatty acid desaturase family protein [Paraburkholderia sp. BL21I4N1]|uniref:fatty acid desaturase family protein n=1 Tax=Paraburkholderia sp. BL21I4N1 TaxID=1938801 RepID=UPI000CFE00F1|nr:fatty acid desaturase family protein [Paraburkholderia sp. BL21I4N1]PQV54575.1 fatty acid desaturase [Paraburkholderia sp. BL21I4N1]
MSEVAECSLAATLQPTQSSRAGANAALSRFAPDAALFVLKPWRALIALAADWGLIAACLAFAASWPHPLTYLAAAVVIARTQLALAVMMHESAHGTLLRNRRLNDALGQALAAGPLFLSLASYRAGHIKHHLAPMRDDDPVAAVFGIADYPVSRARLVRRLIADVCGVSYCVGAWRVARGDFREILPKAAKSSAYIVWEAVSILATNGLLFAGLALCGHPWFYLGLWLLPAITLLPLMGRVRAILEHAGLPAGDDQSLNARTIVAPSWQTFLFGPHGIHYHIEHHLYVRMPFYHLGKVHAQLSNAQLLPRGNLYTSYTDVLRAVSGSDKEAAVVRS